MLSDKPGLALAVFKVRASVADQGSHRFTLLLFYSDTPCLRKKRPVVVTFSVAAVVFVQRSLPPLRCPMLHGAAPEFGPRPH